MKKQYKILSIIGLAIIIIMAISLNFKDSLFKGSVVSNTINVIGSTNSFYELNLGYTQASSTQDIEGLDSGTFFIDFVSPSVVASGFALKLEYSPDGSHFYGLNQNASTTATTFASSTMVSTAQGIEYLYVLPTTSSNASTTLPISFGDISAKSMRVSIKAINGASDSKIWIQFRGKEKIN